MKKAFLVFLALIMIGSVTVAEDGGADSKAYINIGDYNETVIALHQKLANLGYYGLRPESPWSEKSESALKAVRYVLGLDETGIVADRTQYDSIMALDPEEPVFKIKRISGIDEYLEYVRDQGFTIFIAVKDEASDKLQDSTKEILKSMGLRLDWTDDRYRKAYIAVVDGETVVEEIAAVEKTGPALMTSGMLGGVQYSMTSAGYENDDGSISSIKLNDREWSRNMRGLNVAVMAADRVIDSCGFDTCGEYEAKAKR